MDLFENRPVLWGCSFVTSAASRRRAGATLKALCALPPRPVAAVVLLLTIKHTLVALSPETQTLGHLRQSFFSVLLV